MAAKKIQVYNESVKTNIYMEDFQMQPYTHFTLSERDSLRNFISEGKSLRAIAKELNKNVSSISRELKRNKNKDGTYNAYRGLSLYIHRRKRCVRKPRLLPELPLTQYIIEKLNIFWSPELITTMYKRNNPTEKLSFSTIYSYIKNCKLPTISTKNHLRRRGKHRNRGTFTTIKPTHKIHERSADINDRLNVGDFEGDTVLGGVGKGCIATYFDRKSRYLVSQVMKDKSSQTLNKATIKAFNGVRVNSITLDNGSEFARFKELETALNTTIYFADTHSPWQRGTNENGNDLLRFFYPKGYDFRKLPDDELAFVVDLLNDRPRKCLDYLSPKQVFFSKCCT